MTYVVIMPGLDCSKVSHIQLVPEREVVVITEADGTEHSLPAPRDPTDRNGTRHTTDASSIPHLHVKLPDRPPVINQSKVWEAAMAAQSFEEMKNNIAKEQLRQLEEQHLDGVLHNADVSHLEPHIKRLRASLPATAKESINGPAK